MGIIRQRQPNLKLVLSGGRSAHIDLKALAAQKGVLDRVIDLGYIAEKHVYNLYRHAEAMLFTSQYEGFGIPLLEAMRAGCPVICAPVTAIPEVAREAALYVMSDAPEAWVDAFLDQLPAQRSHLILQGYQQAAKFTWKQTRQKWVDAILSVVGASFESG